MGVLKMPGVSLGIDLNSVANGLVIGTGGTGSVAGWNNLRTILTAIIDDIEALVVPSEVDIAADLDFQSAAGDYHRAVNVGGVQFNDLTTQPAAAADIGMLYEFGGNLFFNDSNQNAVRITLNGAVDITSTGQITGMTGSAAVTYTGGGTDEYAFVDHNGYPASLDHGPIRLKEQATAITKAVNLQSPTSLGSNYSWIYPTALPGSGSELITVTSAGQLDTTSNPSVATITATGVAALRAGAKFRASGNGNETLDTFEDVGTYTPVLSVGGSDKTPDTIEGSYCRIGSWVTAIIYCSSLGEDFGTGVYKFTLPYEASDVTMAIVAGSVSLLRAGGTDYAEGACLILTSDPTKVQLKPTVGSSTNSSIASGGTFQSLFAVTISYLTDAAAD